MQAIRMTLSELGCSYAMIRTPYRWGARIRKDFEQKTKQALQPNAVFVPDGHYTFVVQGVPRTIDPESLVATMAEAGFAPYLVGTTFQGPKQKKVVIAAATRPKDVVIRKAGKTGITTLILQEEKCEGNKVPEKEPASPEHKAPRTSPSPARRERGREGARMETDSKGEEMKDDGTTPRKRANQDVTGGMARKRTGRRKKGTPQGANGKGARSPDCCNNKGNTCYVAAALRCVRQAIRSGERNYREIQDPELRGVLTNMTKTNWGKFLQGRKLGGRDAIQDDAALFAEGLMEQEDVLADMFTNEIHTWTMCKGCLTEYHKEEDNLLVRLPIPDRKGPIGIGDMLDEEFNNKEEEVRRECECYAISALTTTTLTTKAPFMMVQARRAGKQGYKCCVHIGLPVRQPMEMLGGVWQAEAVIEHRGVTNDNGHYVSYVKEGETWIRQDDENTEQIDPERVEQLSDKWSAVVLRRIKGSEEEKKKEEPEDEVEKRAKMGSWIQHNSMRTHMVGKNTCRAAMKTSGRGGGGEWQRKSPGMTVEGMFKIKNRKGRPKKKKEDQRRLSR